MNITAGKCFEKENCLEKKDRRKTKKNILPSTRANLETRDQSVSESDRTSWNDI